MRYLYLLLIPFLCAFTPLTLIHDKQDDIDSEFRNIYYTGQGKQFKSFVSTPGLNDLSDREMVVVNSTSPKIMFRLGQEVYSINVSCVTITR